VPLDKHNAGVGARAREFAAAVGLHAHHVEHLGCAGDTHDIGKAEPRFQRLLRGGDERLEPGTVLAKGRRSLNPLQVELGERHEAYSVALLQAHPGLLRRALDPDLVRYLVGTHHGRGRAMMPSVLDEGSKFAVEIDGDSFGLDGAPRLGALGSEWPALFWRLVDRYGPWGLAYLEAILRLADFAQSRFELTGKS
jgi:CRISPR-associated endonuclease/helicase Cas3